jgi:hypothetical protein
MSETRTLREEFGAWLKRTAHTKCSEHACAHCQEVRRLAQLLGGDVNVRGEVFTNEDLIRAGQDWGEGPAERSEPAAASVPLLIDQLADRLEDWAQNEEMIDQFFLGHGKDCNEAAKLLRALSSAPGERR